MASVLDKSCVRPDGLCPACERAIKAVEFAMERLREIVDLHTPRSITGDAARAALMQLSGLSFYVVPTVGI